MPLAANYISPPQRKSAQPQRVNKFQPRQARAEPDRVSCTGFPRKSYAWHRLKSPPKMRMVKLRTLPGILSVAGVRSAGVIVFNSFPM